jgi:hypothetical protein
VWRSPVIVTGLCRCRTLLPFQVIPQQRQRTVEDDRRIAVGHFVAHQRATS